MLTGQNNITSGQIYTHGLSQQLQLQQIFKILGYCPQFDALLEGLTCRETLGIFAMLRGIPTRSVKKYTENIARSLDFDEHIDKIIKNLRFGSFFLRFFFDYLPSCIFLVVEIKEN